MGLKALCLRSSVKMLRNYLVEGDHWRWTGAVQAVTKVPALGKPRQADLTNLS